MDTVIAQYKESLQELLSSTQLSFDENLAKALPRRGGVYRIFEKSADWQNSIYAGESDNLKRRIYNNHLMGHRSNSTFRRKLIDSGQCADENAVKEYLKDLCLVQFIVVKDKAERAQFEHFMIAILKPKFND
jgi:excinuclease UvrABC nuclease subunit